MQNLPPISNGTGASSGASSTFGDPGEQSALGGAFADLVSALFAELNPAPSPVNAQGEVTDESTDAAVTATAEAAFTIPVVAAPIVPLSLPIDAQDETSTDGLAPTATPSTPAPAPAAAPLSSIPNEIVEAVAPQPQTEAIAPDAPKASSESSPEAIITPINTAASNDRHPSTVPALVDNTAQLQNEDLSSTKSLPANPLELETMVYTSEPAEEAAPAAADVRPAPLRVVSSSPVVESVNPQVTAQNATPVADTAADQNLTDNNDSSNQEESAEVIAINRDVVELPAPEIDLLPPATPVADLTRVNEIRATTGVAAPRPVTPPHSQIVTVVAPLHKDVDGTHHLTLQLTPDELGTVNIEVEIKGGQLNLHLQSERGDTRSTLRENLQNLRNELESAGLNAGSLDVGSGPSQFSNRHAQEAKGGNPVLLGTPADEEELALNNAVTPPTSGAAHDGTVDVHV